MIFPKLAANYGQKQQTIEDYISQRLVQLAQNDALSVQEIYETRDNDVIDICGNIILGYSNVDGQIRETVSEQVLEDYIVTLERYVKNPKHPNYINNVPYKKYQKKRLSHNRGYAFMSSNYDELGHRTKPGIPVMADDYEELLFDEDGKMRLKLRHAWRVLRQHGFGCRPAPKREEAWPRWFKVIEVKPSGANKEIPDVDSKKRMTLSDLSLEDLEIAIKLKKEQMAFKKGKK